MNNFNLKKDINKVWFSFFLILIGVSLDIYRSSNDFISQVLYVIAIIILLYSLFSSLYKIFKLNSHEIERQKIIFLSLITIVIIKNLYSQNTITDIKSLNDIIPINGLIITSIISLFVATVTFLTKAMTVIENGELLFNTVTGDSKFPEILKDIKFLTNKKEPIIDFVRESLFHSKTESIYNIEKTLTEYGELIQKLLVNSEKAIFYSVYSPLWFIDEEHRKNKEKNKFEKEISLLKNDAINLFLKKQFDTIPKKTFLENYLKKTNTNKRQERYFLLPQSEIDEIFKEKEKIINFIEQQDNFNYIGYMSSDSTEGIELSKLFKELINSKDFVIFDESLIINFDKKGTLHISWNKQTIKKINYAIKRYQEYFKNIEEIKDSE